MFRICPNSSKWSCSKPPDLPWLLSSLNERMTKQLYTRLCIWDSCDVTWRTSRGVCGRLARSSGSSEWCTSFADSWSCLWFVAPTSRACQSRTLSVSGDTTTLPAVTSQQYNLSVTWLLFENVWRHVRDLPAPTIQLGWENFCRRRASTVSC